MQISEIKVTGEDGKVTIKKVHIIRSWQDAGGAQVYLHTNNVYGYKDGAPIRSDSEFSIIGDPIQRKLAQQWWNTLGRKKSEAFYAERDQALMEAQQEAMLTPQPGENSQLDLVLYRRRPEGSRKKTDFTEPMTHYEWFKSRPDWWGYARSIELGGFFYERVELDEADAPAGAPEGDPDPAKNEAEPQQKRAFQL